MYKSNMFIRAQIKPCAYIASYIVLFYCVVTIESDVLVQSVLSLSHWFYNLI